ncbi:MAG: 4,5-DOPA dioxygenase extradiol [Bacteroidota bacterium]|nr:4,5-DOPA dioxygenase extradiol [Bacteroidota bacterium]
MNRKEFLTLAAALPFTGSVMNLHGLKNLADDIAKTERMPLLFVGHGNPMNAIEDNKFSNSWKDFGKTLPKPTAILSVSAHWLTRGTRVTAMAKPRTIHDFGGFPEKLFAQQYPAPGAPELAKETQALVTKPHIILDDDWGFDHGTWSVLIQMFPKADIPVFQLSIDYNQSMQYHYNIAQQLQVLREKGVLIIGSGNIVHNLQAVTFNSNKPYDWALEFDANISKWIESGNHQAILDFQKLGTLAKSAHPTNDHFLPLMYVLGFQNKKDTPTFFNNDFDMSSVSMRSVIYQ